MNYDGTWQSFNQGFRHQRNKVFVAYRRGAVLTNNNGDLSFEGRFVPIIKQMISPTDFWEEYTLAK